MKRNRKNAIMCSVVVGAAIWGVSWGYSAKAAQPVEINETNFPDEDFRQYVSDEIDADNDGRLSDLEIEGVTNISVERKGISSLVGIEYFKNLQTLHCYDNFLHTLDVSQNMALVELLCGGNKLRELDVSRNTALKMFSCSYNNDLNKLDVSKNIALETLYCAGNDMRELDLSQNTALKNFDCNWNKLTELDVSQNTALESLFCADNKLSELDVSHNIALKSLSCPENNLGKLDVSKNTALVDLNCSENNLSKLDVSQNTALTRLVCDNNFFASGSTSFDMAAINGFNPLMASGWTNAAISGTVVTAVDVTQPVTYTYDCGGGYSEEFSFMPGAILDPNIRFEYDLKIKEYGTDSFKNRLTVESNGAVSYSSSDTSVATVDNEGNVTIVGVGNCTITATVAESGCYREGSASYTLKVRKTTRIVEINEINFPDEVFRQYVSVHIDEDGDGYLNDLEIESESAVGIDFSEVNIDNIYSLEGIEYLKNLRYLNCGDNHLDKLDVSQNVALRKLNCNNNQLSCLDLNANSDLVELYCEENCFSNGSASFNTASMEGFDISKASKWTNASISGTVVTAVDVTQPVTYVYDCGSGCSATFSFIPERTAVNPGTDNIPPDTKTDQTNPGITPNDTVNPGGAVVGKGYTVSNANYKILTSAAKSGTVEYSGFAGNKLKSVKIPDSVVIEGVSYKVVSIAKKAFYKKSSLKKVVIGRNVTSIGASAFERCKNLKDVTIGKSVKKIGKKTFSGDMKLRTIIVKSKVLASVGKRALPKVKNLKIKVPKAKVKAYKKLFTKKGANSIRVS